MAAHVRISFVRLNSWPAGVRYHVLWNGQVAANGDGMPGDDPDAPVDGDNPLTPDLIEIWPTGKAGIGDEPVADGVCGDPANYGPGVGAGEGAAGDGEAGLHGNLVTWTTQSVLPTLRDGTYRFAIALFDAFGNEMSGGVQEVAVVVAGVPRPPTNFSLVEWDSDDGRLVVSWNHSPDLQD